MPTLKETKKRILSAKTVYKITKAMKLVAASKARAAQIVNSATRPYSDKIYEMVSNLWPSTDSSAHPLLSVNNSKKHCYILITTDKGLCGSLIDNIEDFLVKEKVLESDGNSFIVVGKKGADILLKHGRNPMALFEIGLRKPLLEFVHPIVKLFKDGYLDSKFGDVSVIYTSFISSFKQNPSKKLILPAVFPDKKTGLNNLVTYEPNADVVLENLLPRYLEIQLYQLILESVASEHSARMIAMDNASTNAEEMIDELNLIYNKVRQEKITQQLLEITTTISTM